MGNQGVVSRWSGISEEFGEKGGVVRFENCLSARHLRMGLTLIADQQEHRNTDVVYQC